MGELKVKTETVLTVTCRHGQPIEFILLNK